MKGKIYSLILGIFLLGQFGCVRRKVKKTIVIIKKKGLDNSVFCQGEKCLKKFIEKN